MTLDGAAILPQSPEKQMKGRGPDGSLPFQFAVVIVTSYFSNTARLTAW
jgi:hypothetical protein